MTRSEFIRLLAGASAGVAAGRYAAASALVQAPPAGCTSIVVGHDPSVGSDRTVVLERTGEVLRIVGFNDDGSIDVEVAPRRGLSALADDEVVVIK